MLKSREVPSVTDSQSRHGLRLLISSRDAQALKDLQVICQSVAGLQVITRLVSNGHCDPLHGIEQMPDLLLLQVSTQWREELAALMQRPAAERPALLVCGALDQAEGLRLAMQAGARDFLPEPLNSHELAAALQRMVQEKRASSGDSGKLLAVMNAKGGSGATLLACNLAQQLSLHASVLLIDLDLQFGSVTHYLDVQPTHSHVDVLKQVGEMDSLALRGFCTHFSANLHVLGGRSTELCLPQDIHAEQLEALLHLARSTYDWVVVDLPRQIDHLTGTTLENADKVLVVLQQSVSHLKDADRLLRILRDDMGIQSSRLQVLINRYNKNATVSLKDIEEALHCPDLLLLPNDFTVVSESQNAGVPLAIHAPRAAITLALKPIAEELQGSPEVQRGGLFKRAVSRLFGGVSHAQ
ncbi:AAA family ATPase [Pseudomonas sp. MAP12]|uniref:AAA family ATPase n=1 Tax=Geopseudomonas aromaticivorans TaxID=2849492 RepID=A0ABS6N0D1_9GAMM|nr:AAA family ATPase [Pseudomonas aromaticivorans]MBV2134513.1 AAA family ATPase [Pseudomonas aromaticivorans]